MKDHGWVALLHDWVVRAEYDAGYILLRCSICGEEGLADAPRVEPGMPFTTSG